MATLGHLAIGLVAGRVFSASGEGRQRGIATVGFAALSFLPDADVVAFTLGIPYGSPFGHRGAAHSIVVAAAMGTLVGVVAWLGLRAPWRRAAWVACLSALVVASHGVLDAFTDGGRGIALLWPFTDARYFAPWRPTPVAPIGWSFLGARGLTVLGTEALLFAPLLAWGLWPRRHGRVPEETSPVA